MNDDGPEITPQVLHLRDLLKWVTQGRVAVPRFQRDFVWDRPKMLQLFDSLRRQYPVGTILLWETSQSMPHGPYLGPLELPSSTVPPYLVLDGQQRLTTLAGVLLFGGQSANPEEADPGRWDILYDAEADAFCHLKRPKISAFPVRNLMTTEGLLNAALELNDQPNKALWLKRLQSMANALSSYRIPLVIFSTDSLDLAVDSFTRLNRAGQTVGADEMVSALTYKDDFHLSSHIDQILTLVNTSGFGQIDRMLVLRSILVSIGLDPYKTEWHQLTQERREAASKKLPQALEKIQAPLLQALQFLTKEGIETSCQLPYGVLLTGLTLFFWDRQPTPQQELWLRRWLWVSSFTGAYGSSNVSRFRRVLEGLKNAPQQLEQDLDLAGPALPFPTRHDGRSARVRALLVALMPSDSALRSQLTDQLRKAGPEAYLRIVSSSSSPANRVLAVLNAKQSAKEFLLQLDSSQMEHYLVNSKALTALAEGREEDFLALRQGLMQQREQAFMDSKGVTPTSEAPAPAPLDADF